MSKIKSILNLVNKFKKNETKKNASLSLFGNLLYSVLGFVGIALLARSLQLNEYGDWVIYLTAGSLLEMMRLGFMHTALVRFSSGSTESEQKEYIASGWIIGMLFSLVLSLSIFSVFLIVYFFEIKTSYYYFLMYYPIFTIIGLPISVSLSILQFKMQFAKILRMRITNMSLNILVFLSAYVFKLHIETVIQLHLISTFTSSLNAICNKWSGIEYIKLYSKSKMKELMNFGKFSLGTLIGTNLLKSADTFILGLTLGAESAALYSVPLKLTETFEILLRSIVSVALPKMSSYSVKSQNNEVKRVFQDYSGMLTFVYIPVMLFCFIFAEYLLGILGGHEYIQMANVFRVFCFYGLLLPIDRFTGVTLDCINLPSYNLRKVVFMTLFNI
ncbi:MAG: oligosaccharide flippase family protein, partial [Bacteroidia bacterium]|nr:oligosaccharide flippase family protein [Bacteroidia bacterium]